MTKRKTVDQLFKLVNVIVDAQISVPKQISSIYDGLPPSALAQIEKRDKEKRR